MESGNLDEIVATGDLFKQAKKQVNNWTLRKFLLSGIHLTYFDDNGSVKGRIDISGCIVRRVSPEECHNPACKFAFGLFTNRKVRRCLVCATNEEDRNAWIQILEAQISEFQDVVRRFVYSSEEVAGSSVVIKKNLIGIESSYRLVITNYPRMLLIDPVTCKLKDQILFTREALPTLKTVDDLSFVIRHKAREFKLKDMRGSAYWATVFRNLASLPPFVLRSKQPIFIGQVLVANAPSEASLRKAATSKDVETHTHLKSVPRPNLRSPLPVVKSGFAAVRLGLGRMSELSSGSSIIVSRLREAQVVSTLEGSGDDEMDGNGGDAADKGQDEFEYDDADESQNDYVPEDEYADYYEDGPTMEESIECLKGALASIKAVVEAVGREIENMAAPKARKQELVRALMLNVSALSSNLQGLVQQGSVQGGLDRDMVATITEVVDEAADMFLSLTELIPSRSNSFDVGIYGDSGNGSSQQRVDKAAMIEAFSSGFGEMSSRLTEYRRGLDL